MEEQQPIVYGQPSLLNTRPVNPESIRYTGIIKIYNEIKGFGFITWNNKDIYFSSKNTNIKPGMKVSFSITKGHNGDIAINIKYQTGR